MARWKTRSTTPSSSKIGSRAIRACAGGLCRSTIGHAYPSSFGVRYVIGRDEMINTVEAPFSGIATNDFERSGCRENSR